MHYRHTLETLGKADGVIGMIFRKAQNKIQDPAKLKRLAIIPYLTELKRRRKVHTDRPVL
ncbi:MAG: hypothetical protein ABI671_18205 [Burkholderiales bacterium]